MATLVIVRHGQSVWNLENRFTGFENPPLTPQGEAEAKSAGEKLRAAGIVPHTVFTSTLERAWRTAQLVLASAGYDLPMTKVDDLRERDYGDLTGLNKSETAEKYGDEQVHIWRRSYDIAPPGGESLADVVVRAGDYFRAHILPLLNDEKDVMIAAHGNSLRALLIVLGLYTPQNIHTAEIPTGAPMVMDVTHGRGSNARYL